MWKRKKGHRGKGSERGEDKVEKIRGVSTDLEKSVCREVQEI